VGDSRNGGTTWEVTGPFRTVEGAGASPSTTLADAASSAAAAGEGDDDGSGSLAVPLAGAAVALGAVGAGAPWLRSRRAGCTRCGRAVAGRRADRANPTRLTAPNGFPARDRSFQRRISRGESPSPGVRLAATQGCSDV
jgi:hypothetical protein